MLTRFMTKEMENSITATKRSKCQAATAALVAYLELERNIYIKPFLLSVHYQHNEEGTFIDSGTCKFLELTTCASRASKSVNDVLNYCKTTNGENMLRSSLLEPPTGKLVIKETFSEF